MSENRLVGIENEEGTPIPVLQFVANLPISEKDKDNLCAALAVSNGIGYELGFKAAMAINTGLDFEDPRLIKLIIDMKEVAKFNIAKAAKDYRDGLNMYKKDEDNKDA